MPWIQAPMHRALSSAHKKHAEQTARAAGRRGMVAGSPAAWNCALRNASNAKRANTCWKGGNSAEVTGGASYLANLHIDHLSVFFAPCHSCMIIKKAGPCITPAHTGGG